MPQNFSEKNNMKLTHINTRADNKDGESFESEPFSPERVEEIEQGNEHLQRIREGCSRYSGWDYSSHNVTVCFEALDSPKGPPLDLPFQGTTTFIWNITNYGKKTVLQAIRRRLNLGYLSSRKPQKLRDFLYWLGNADIRHLTLSQSVETRQMRSSTQSRSRTRYDFMFDCSKSYRQEKVSDLSKKFTEGFGGTNRFLIDPDSDVVVEDRDTGSSNRILTAELAVRVYTGIPNLPGITDTYKQEIRARGPIPRFR